MVREELEILEKETELPHDQKLEFPFISADTLR